jgi:asparagine synthase (glutamine-hydrolysing)
VDNNPLTVDSPTDVCRGGSWFAVLPDCDAAPAAAQRLAGTAQVERHASGRPWLVGRWPAEELTVGAAGDNRIGVFGAGSTTAAELDSAAAVVRDVRDLDRLAARLPGSFHLVASVDGQVRVQGALSGLRRVFQARLGDLAVAADRCDVLAAATGAAIAPERLAACLLTPEAPFPFEGEPMWQGVDALPEDHYLVLDRRGAGTPVRWWTPPPPVLSLAEGAGNLREALSNAVAARVRTGKRLSCDLSGGLDSTPVCYLTAAALRERGDRLVSITITSDDASCDDPRWADIAARSMPNLDRLLVAAEQLPPLYEDLLRPDLSEDEPLLDPGARRQTELIVAQLRAHGAELHLTGDGGDELLQPAETYLRELFWRRPRLAVTYLRGYRALYRWSWRATLGILADRRSYGAWLAASAEKLTGPPSEKERAEGSGFAFRLPPWATEAAADMLRTRIRAVAADVRRLAPTVSQHQELEMIRVAGHAVRRSNQLAARFGLAHATPFLDDRVIEACMAVRPEERTTPWRYKPIITEAMRGLLPDEWLRRNTKADGTEMHHAGLRAHRERVLQLCEDSELARLGLIDPEVLRANTSGMWTSGLWPIALTSTLGLERWLRDVASAGQRATVGVKG